VSADVALAPVPATTPRAGSAGWAAEAAVARRGFGQVRIAAALWALVFGGSIASSALAYVQAFPTLQDRLAVAATTSSDTGMAILLGPIATIETVPGYTVYKNYVFLTTVGAIWALLAATRLLRKEEDTGRWHLVMAGGTRPARATAATLVALAGAVGVLFVGTTLITLLAGRSPEVGFTTGGVLVYGLSLMIPPAVFVGVGALTSQLASTRRLATGLAMGVFGAAFLLRMAGDAGPELAWARWLTPFGWTELMRPMTENNLAPLVPAVLTTAALAGAAVVLAGRRDVGSGVLSTGDSAPPRSFGLTSATGLSLRLELPMLVAWVIGAAATGLFFGVVAEMTTKPVPESMGTMLDKFAVQGSFTEQFFGIGFLMIAGLVALLPAALVGSAADEELTGRLVQVFVQPATRTAWFVGRLVLTAVAVVVAAASAGAATWIGAATLGVPVELATMVGAGLNTVPLALVALGVGAVALALVPRAAGPVVYALVIWSLLVYIATSLLDSLRWLGTLGLFHWFRLVPGEAADAGTLVGTTAVALVLMAAATVLFARRDLHRG
jgi:ABC-2 type transport system permease protein